VSSVATVFGEKIVMRLLDKSKSMVSLGQLGMPAETYKTYSKLIHSPFGMVICAGPTGAGKTTTLYATLNEVNSTGKNVMTIEDPVEYVFPGINQIQTNDQAGIGFATGLKAILRQDPDVILVGEVRDADTARIAIQSALTGHFVLSSLHGTDAVAALHRFLDMGIESFLIASSVVAVVGQRLLRRIVRRLQGAVRARPEEIAFFEERPAAQDRLLPRQGLQLLRRHRLPRAHRRVRAASITPEIRRLIVGWATQEELRRLAVAQGMRTMEQRGNPAGRARRHDHPRSHPNHLRRTSTENTGASHAQVRLRRHRHHRHPGRRHHQGRHPGRGAPSSPRSTCSRHHRGEARRARHRDHAGQAEEDPADALHAPAGGVREGRRPDHRLAGHHRGRGAGQGAAPHPRRHVARLRNGGSTFSDACGAHPEAFPDYYVGILQSAELTGKLDEALDQLADYLDREIDTRAKVVSALSYPPWWSW
jgi:DNA polymerase III delta prime subunit